MKYKNSLTGITLSLFDYLTLIEETAKVIRADKRGSLNENACALLTHLGINNTIKPLAR